MIEHGNRKDSVCIDRLKPAYLNETLPEHTNPCNHTSNLSTRPTSHAVTRSGRHVHFPDRYK